MTAEVESPANPGIIGALEALDNDNDLLALEKLIGRRFNIFDALGIEDFEIRHSNFLAFLLDPAESHGQGSLFLKAVLKDLLEKSPPRLRPLTPAEMEKIDLSKIVVKREWLHTDIFLRCRELGFFIVIENKIRANEGPDQLERYEKDMRKLYPNDRPLLVYLTLEGEKPSEDNWMAYSHKDVNRVLKGVRESHGNAIDKDVQVFLDHYINLIGTRFMNDEIDELCQRISKKHSGALDLIWRRGRAATSGRLAAIDVVQQDDRWEIRYQSANEISGVPKTWAVWLPELGSKGVSRDWIRFVLLLDGKKITSGVSVGPFADFEKRKEIVTKLLEEISGCNFNRPKDKPLKNNWSAITVRETISDWDEETEIEEIREAAQKALNDLYPRLEKLEPILKRLCNLPASAT